MTKKRSLPDFEALARQIMKDLPDEVAITALNFFKESFFKQGFTDQSFQPWDNRKTPGGGRAILTSTTNLRESIRILEASDGKIEIGTDVPYAAIHNEGGIINVPVTPKSRKYFWYMFKATGNTVWKWMAITKKKHLTIYIPKRQYIGESQTLNSNIDSLIPKRIVTALKNLK